MLLEEEKLQRRLKLILANKANCPSCKKGVLFKNRIINMYGYQDGFTLECPVCNKEFYP